MAVPVGLDDRPELGARELGQQPLRVVPDGAEVDRDVGAGHRPHCPTGLHVDDEPVPGEGDVAVELLLETQEVVVGELVDLLDVVEHDPPRVELATARRSVNANVASYRRTGCSAWMRRSPVKTSYSQIPIGITARSQPLASVGGSQSTSSSITTSSRRPPPVSSNA